MAQKILNTASPDITRERKGYIAAVISFSIWGLFPLFWHLLYAVPALQVLSHRIIWGGVLVLGWLFITKGVGWITALIKHPKIILILVISALLIGFNWGLYTWAVINNHVVETSLGYYITPLINIFLGVVLLQERLRAIQWLAVTFASLGVIWMTWQLGAPPWIALGLAFSFSFYGFVRKHVTIDSVEGIGIESLVLILPAIAYLFLFTSNSTAITQSWPWHIYALLLLGGLVSAAPLLCFTYAVQRVPLSLVGLMQYFASTSQLLIGIFIFHEAFDADRAVGFIAIWIGLILLSIEGLWHIRQKAKTANP